MFGVKELSVEHILMLAIVALLLYHLVGRCGNGFSVGSRGDEFTWPTFWGDNAGIGDCNKHTNIDDCHNNNCLYFPEAGIYKPDNGIAEIGKCRGLPTINWLSKQGVSQCKESYKDTNGSGIGHIINLDVGYYNSSSDIDRCETQSMCVPNTIKQLEWSDTRAPFCKSGCKNEWHEFGKVNQSTLDSSHYGCINGNTYNKCITGNRSICQKK